jgi:flavin reductase (DIM6/NTAB) family NADH-FMN oxidoreductase RutF
MRSFDFGSMPTDDCYRLMTSTIVPRPIAWVVSCSLDGVRNAAPYSFFNMVGSEPPLVAIGVLAGKSGCKDTAENVAQTGEFVVNLVPETLKDAMNATCASVPPEIDEIALARLETVASIKVRPPRIAGCPVAFECQTFDLIETGPRQVLIIGRVVMAHIAEPMLSGSERPRVNTPGLGLIGRMQGADMYVRTTDLFSMPRPD